MKSVFLKRGSDHSQWFFLKSILLFLLNLIELFTLFYNIVLKREGTRLEPLLLATVSQPWCTGNNAHMEKDSDYGWMLVIGNEKNTGRNAWQPVG